MLKRYLLTAIEIYTSLATLDSRLAEAASGCSVVWLFLISLTHWWRIEGKFRNDNISYSLFNNSCAF